MRERLLTAVLRGIGRRLRRPVVVLGLLLLTGYTTVGFVRQEEIARGLSQEVAARQQELDDARQEQQLLAAEVAALNDPVHYGQYAVLVGRHTLMLTRPDEKILLVTWQDANGVPVPQHATDWKALLRAAGIPNP